jgi:hypothetical protein
VSVICLVPTPLRAERAARRLCDAENGILFGARVTTLDALVPGLLAAAGDRRPVLSPLAERLLALEAGEAAGGPFAALAPESGLARALASALGELRRGEVGPSEVRKAAAELDGRGDGGVLQQRRGDRLSILAAALEAYEVRLGALGALDRPAALRAAADTLARGALSEEVRDLDLLVLDGFRALPAAAFDLVAALAHRARRVHARVPFFPERPDVSAPAEQLLRRLEGLHELAARREVTVALEHLDAGGERSPRLARVLRALAGGPGGGPDDSAGLALQGAPGEGRAASIGLVLGAVGAGEEGDAEVGARLAAGLLERGFGAEEIIVLAPSPVRLAPRLARACAELGVPFASGRGLPLAELPPVRAARDALAAAVQPSRAALEAAIASPYLGLTRAPARLGFWLDRAGAIDGRGDPEQALRRRAAALRSPAAAPERAALLRSATALAALRSALRPLGAPGLPREHAARLGALAIGPGSGARRRAARAEPELARRDLAALARLDEVADDLVGALGLLGRGDEALSAERWQALLDLALDGAAAPPSPEPAGGAVELWPLTEAPGLAARAVIVLGCARGSFPPSPPPEPLLRDAERAAVNRAVCRAAVTSGPMGRAEALHVAFCAFAAGREVLALTWPGAGPEGDGSGPAPLAVEALVAAGVEVPAAPARDPDLAGSRSAAEALRAAARAARDGEAGAVKEGPIARSLELRARAASVFARGAMEAERQRAVLARRASPVAGALPEALLPELSRSLPAEWSPSLLETHARCPFRLFAGLVLGLSDPDTADLDIDPRDEGKLAHAIMERFLRSRLTSGGLPLRGAPEEREGLRAVASALFSVFEADGRTGDPAAWSGRRAAVLSRLERVVEAEAAEGAEANGPHGVVAPTLLEYRFGGDSGVPPLVFPDDSSPGGPGREIRLRGRLDRVDASPERLVLIDYKDSRARADWKEKLEIDALGETNFQVPAYLMAASRALPGRSRLEATYLLLRSAERVEPFLAEAGHPLFAVDEAARAAARDAGVVPFADAVVAAVRRIRAGELPIASRDCTGCAFGAVCRFQSLAEGPP